MRTTAMVLGIIGGVFGILFSLLAMVIGGAGAALNAEGGGTVTGLGFVAFFLAVAAIVGGALANKSPRASWIILLATGILGFIAISAFWILPGVLLIAAGIFELFARKDKKAAPPVNLV
ncbi:MAG: DUF4064 domain-containing protein [Thermoleophilia bacterium]